ncbi:MAG: biliverdin-producing heme oxygenase [Bradymonadaceae bacterium]
MATDPLDAIRDRTGAAHDRVEAVMSARFFDVDSFDVDRFRELLVAYYGLYRPLDRRLERRIEELMPDFEHRDRAGRLASDLETIGMEPAAIDQLPVASLAAMPALETAPALAGCLYVVEGSALGKRVIRRDLAADLGDDLLGADAFFADRPEETSRRWQAFREHFRRRVDRSEALEAAVQSASSTFRVYTEWFDE